MASVKIEAKAAAEWADRIMKEFGHVEAATLMAAMMLIIARAARGLGMRFLDVIKVFSTIWDITK